MRDADLQIMTQTKPFWSKRSQYRLFWSLCWWPTSSEESNGKRRSGTLAQRWHGQEAILKGKKKKKSVEEVADLWQ